MAAEVQAKLKGGEFLITASDPQDVFTPEDFTDEHQMIAQSAQQFVEQEILPQCEQIEHQESGFDCRAAAQSRRRAGSSGHRCAREI